MYHSMTEKDWLELEKEQEAGETIYTQLFGYRDLNVLKAALDECPHVFVYGSLKANEGNHDVLTGSTFISEATTVDEAVLGDIGFPYLFPNDVVPVKHSNLLFPVKGEVYAINTPEVFASLDGLEGYPSHYNRRVVDLDIGVSAWVYVQEDWSNALRCSACDLTKGVWSWTRQ